MPGSARQVALDLVQAGEDHVVIELRIAVAAQGGHVDGALEMLVGLLELVPLIIDFAQLAVQGLADRGQRAGPLHVLDPLGGDIERKTQPAALHGHQGQACSTQQLRDQVGRAAAVLDEHLVRFDRPVIVVHQLIGGGQRRVDHAAAVMIAWRCDGQRLLGQLDALRRLALSIEQARLQGQPLGLQGGIDLG